MVGIGLYARLPVAVGLYLIVAAGVALAAVLARGRPLTASGLFCLAWLAAGAAAGQLAAYRYPADSIGLYAADESRLCQVELALDDPPRTITNPFDARQAVAPKQVALARVVRLRAVDGWRDASGDVLLQVNDPHPRLAAGQTVRATGLLQRPAPAMNPGQFDWASYYRDRRVLASFTVGHAACLDVVADPGAGPLTAARLKARRLLADGFSADQALNHALLRALLLGDNDPVLRDVQEQFQQTGTAHHLAISGTHVALLGAMVWGVCRLLALNPRTAAWVALLFTLAYGALALPSPPVVRSIVLATAMGLAVISGRRGQALTLLAASVVAMLVYHPPDLFNAGFQLSFGTVLGLVLLGRPALRATQSAAGWNDPDKVVLRSFETPSPARRAWNRFNESAHHALATGLVAWFVSMPLIAYHFEQLNPWAIVAGIALAPFVLVALAGGMLKVLLTLAWPGLAGAWAAAAAVPVDGMRRFVGWLATWPVADVPVPPSPGWLLALYYLLLLTAVIPDKPDGVRWVLRTARVAVALFVVLPPFQAVVNPPVPAGTTRVTLLAVGAGQCAVVQPPGGRTVLADAGSSSLADLIGKCLGPFLRHARVTAVDTLVLSHADFDHVSAAAEVTRAYGVREVPAGDRFAAHAGGSPQTQHLLGELAGLNRPPRTVLPGQRVPIGRDTTIEILWPPAAAAAADAGSRGGSGSPTTASTGAKPRSGRGAAGKTAGGGKVPAAAASNDGSLVFRLTHAGGTVLFPGDIQDGAMRELLKEPAKLRADVLVAMHHGSSESLTKAFVDAVDPAVVVSSNDRTLTGKQRRFDQLVAGRRLLRTNDAGAVTITMGPDGRVTVEPFVKRE
ncbi:MAG: putative hydrolase [Phycisphaerales bacterium]|nr:putative hydrolase [Phycisphaerales bacterium]